MDIIPLPNQEDDMSDNGLVVDYCVRITSCSKFASQDLIDFINQEFSISRYVIGRETVPQEHFHLVISLDTSVSLLEVRDIIKAFLVPLWATESGKLPHGFGNKQYNLQVCEDLDKAVSYSVKLGEYWYEGFEEDYINARKAESFEKKKPTDFKAELITLRTEFQESDMDILEFETRFVLLKAKYDQQVVHAVAHSYALSALYKRNPEQAALGVENYLYKQ